MSDSLTKLYHSGLQFLVPLTPEETYKILVREAKKIIHANHGTIIMWDNKTVKRVYSTNPFPLSFLPRENGYTKLASKSGEVLVINVQKIIKVHPELAKIKFRKAVMVPLSYQNHAYGVLILTLKKNARIYAKEKKLLKIYGAIASLSIRKTQLYKEAEKAIESRDILIGLIAHELRTPLTSITSYVQLLERKIKQTKNTVPVWVKELSISTIIMKKLINELMNLDLLQSGKFTYSLAKIRIAEVIEEAIRKFAVENPSANITFSNYLPKEKSLIKGDLKRLIQALDNLFENAEKFSPPDTSIDVILKKKKEKFVIEVKDKGIGIPQRSISKLFKPFSRAHGGYEEGIGLGLFLAKNIIHQHAGTIHITSKEKIGTTVTIQLPEYNE